MYEPTLLMRVGHSEIARLLVEARARIPTVCNGSFIEPYPFVPDCLAYHSTRQVRLVGLYPSQQIVAHADVAIRPAIRLHLPLQTNEDCWVFHGGGWQQLHVGYVYKMDPTWFHGAVNWGTTLRLHLMIDILEEEK